MLASWRCCACPQYAVHARAVFFVVCMEYLTSETPWGGGGLVGASFFIVETVKTAFKYVITRILKHCY